MSEKADRAELEALREALIEGEKSGVAGPLDIERIKGAAGDEGRWCVNPAPIVLQEAGSGGPSLGSAPVSRLCG